LLFSARPAKPSTPSSSRWLKAVEVNPIGRSRGGRGGGYRDDHRDRYSGGGGGRRDYGSFRDRDSSRGFDNGPKKSFGTGSQNGGYGGGSSNGGGGGNSFNGGSYNGNGQSNFGANQGSSFGGQNNFQPPQQFGGAQNGASHPPFPPFPPQAQAPQQPPPPPMMPYPMPPQFTQ